MSVKVYYLDDELDICENFRDYFASDQVQIKIFTDARKAIEAAHQDMPDVFFIDFRLIGTNGDEVAKAMPAEIPKYLVTGEIDSGAEYPFKAVLSKPTKIEDIQKVIQDLVSSSSRSFDLV